MTRKGLKRIREEQSHLASQYEKIAERFEDRRGVIREKIARGEKKDEIHIEVAHEVLSFLKCITLRDTDEILWYDDIKGIWKSGGKSRIKQICHQFNDRFTTHDVNEIIEKIRRMTYREREIFENHNLIAFKNCVLNLKDFSFSEHKPDNYLLSRLEVEYKPDAFPFKFEKFFNRILPDKNRNLILEVMAYPFINGYRYNKAFLLFGSGANGKSTLLGIEKELLGGKNVTAFTMQCFEKNQFAASQLFGKMANICPDMSSKAMQTTQAFKILTGNDWATFNVKGKKAISFRNRAKMIFCANDLPIIYEDTLAIWRRLCVIHLTETIPEEEQDPELLLKLTTDEELSGILNLLLVSLKNLLDRGRFEGLESIKERRDQYIKKSDVIHAFCEDALEVYQTGWIASDKLFTAQCRYAKEIGIQARTKQALTKRLQLFIPEVYKSTREINKKNVRGWAGIRIKEEWKDLIK